MSNWLKLVGTYLLHVLIGTPVVFYLAILLGIGVNAVNQRASDLLVWAPVFPVEIVLGLLLGFAVNRFLIRSPSAKWAWIPSALLLVSDFPSSVKSMGWNDTLSYLFAGKCSDCLEVAILIAPLYASIAYSLGAWIALRRSTAPDSSAVGKEFGTVGRLLLLSLYSASVVIGVFVLTFVLVLGTKLGSRSAGMQVEAIFSRPYYLGEIAMSLVGGAFVGPRARPDLAKWVWLLPSISLLIISVFILYGPHSTAQMGTAQHVWSRFYTSACENSYIACPQETYGVCPFLSSIAYSLAAWITFRNGTSRPNIRPVDLS